MPEKYLTQDDAAEALQVTPKTIRKYIADGTLKAYRVGGRTVRIREADLASCLKAVN
ncbi:helix-turn-helix domain-containing protein [Rhodococcus sp. SORGH_AS_0303]|uniref:helix-turn-helix domain-containing protein n=1 Tax=Rhodococcus sp. SORGH_AS_0303 TaxID=3041753 RepID=UPI002784BCF2|nr:helix-turn-helix domain-containing protein [Rhodococcus sp. SORGH_AS_0303]MDQ1202726.1 excisionase family DNA binding protein [Rhodococcus sp. SORGH_AS_0303]